MKRMLISLFLVMMLACSAEASGLFQIYSTSENTKLNEINFGVGLYRDIESPYVNDRYIEYVQWVGGEVSFINVNAGFYIVPNDVKKARPEFSLTTSPHRWGKTIDSMIPKWLSLEFGAYLPMSGYTKLVEPKSIQPMIGIIRWTF